jgi:DNA ligase D-like protein (predicted 3'-phosphoesterase)
MARFVVHEHDALKAGLHHDLRLERNGVLKSWAVPKGVPEDSGVRRVAIQVEDHALSYGKFEGNIPKGQYGAGNVRIWDSGVYKTKSWNKTKIEVTLYGKKLSGDYMLRWMERMKSWLLWKC